MNEKFLSPLPEDVSILKKRVSPPMAPLNWSYCHSVADGSLEVLVKTPARPPSLHALVLSIVPVRSVPTGPEAVPVTMTLVQSVKPPAISSD